MYLSSLELRGFRNYRALQCALSPGINLIYGANGQGKTNLIESVYYMSIGKTYRQVKDEHLVRWGEAFFRIIGSIESRHGKTTIEARFAKEENPSKTISTGGVRLAKLEEISGVLTTILFSPESMSIIKGAPQERRRFLNYDISQISLPYSASLHRYERLLAQRNALLKRLSLAPMPLHEKRERLSVWDQQIVEHAAGIIEKRIRFIDKLTPLVRLIHRKLTDGKENMELQYLLHAKNGIQVKRDDTGKWDIEGFLREVCHHTLEEDLKRGTTQWGPQRDDIKVVLDGTDMRHYGSQGQQRTGVLSLKLAELEIFRGETGEYPILLLDDVMSELDENRQQQLLKFIDEKNIQCIITATEAKNPYFHEKRQAKQFIVWGGEIHEQNVM